MIRRPYGNGSATQKSIDERASIIRLRTRVGQLEHELAKKTCECGELRFEVDQCREEIKRLRAELARYTTPNVDNIEVKS